MSNRKEREFARREREILDCTLELLGGEHWESISVDNIASYTGIGKGTIYKHFGCKDDIYARLLYEASGQVRDAYLAFANDFSMTGIGQLRSMLRYLLEFHRDNVAYQHMHVYCKQKSFRERISVESLAAIDDIDQQLIDSFGMAVRKGIDEKEVNPNLPPEVILVGINATFEGAALALQEGSSRRNATLETLEQKTEYINQVVDFMLASICGPGARQV